jgi:hypothetical protein
MKRPDPIDTEAFAKEYLAALEPQPMDTALAHARVRFAEHVHGVDAPVVSWRRRLTPLLLAASAAAAVAVLAWPEPPLSMVVRGKGEPSADVVETSAQSETLDFSDGSEVVVGPASQLRVEQMTAQGATMSLEHGSARVSVVHRTAKTRWTFMAGPYRVTVVGTRFELTWNPRTGGVDVKMDEGTVEVDGPGLAKQRVTTSQRLEAFASPPRASLFLGPPPAEVPAPAVTAPPAPAPLAASKGARAVERPKTRGPTWRYLANTGDALGALVAAEQTGFAWLANSMPKGDVLLLGDTAARADSPARAKEAWLAVRERFRGTDTAAEAAIRLGTLAFEVERDAVGGGAFFARAIQEAPNGPSAPVALGRWMELLAQAGKLDDARRVARDYVRRYPNGAQVELARKMLRP